MSNKNKRKADIVTKMTITGVLGLVLILVVVLAIACSSVEGKKPSDVDPIEETNDDKTEDNTIKDYARVMAVVKNVDTTNKKLTIVNVDDDEFITLNIDGAVDIKDEYGSVLTLAQLRVGDMVETKYDKNNMRPDNVYKTAKTWERKNVSNLLLNTENKTIQIANDIYTYTEDLVALFNGQLFDITQMDPVDEYTVRGYKDKVWTIILENGHGFITLKNHGKFVGGILEVGTKMTVDITDVTTVTVPVGVHELILNKEGMTPYVAQVMVEEDKEVVLNVDQALPKIGMVEFHIIQDNVELNIGDKIYSNFAEPISLDYGEYTISIEKDNYVKWERTLVVDKAYTYFEIDLEKEPIFLHVDSPEGAEVYIDGTFIGVIPISTPINPGGHTIRVRQEGYYIRNYDVIIEEGSQDNYLTFPELVKIEEPEPTPTPEPEPETPTDPPTDGNDPDSGTDNEEEPDEDDEPDTTPGNDVYGN